MSNDEIQMANQVQMFEFSNDKRAAMSLGHSDFVVDSALLKSFSTWFWALMGAHAI
jgi:hypothetical protein